MKGRYFAHGHVRTVIGIFGYVFNRILISRFSDDGTAIDKLVHVPIIHVPRSRIYKHIPANDELVAQTKFFEKYYAVFPRMAFQFNGLTYKADEQLSPSINYKSGRQFGKVPAPYELDFSLVVVARGQLDALQVVEQIIPMFRPNLVVELKSEVFDLNTRQINIHLSSISHEDNYEDLETERFVTYTLNFTVSTPFWGFVTNADIEYAKFVECGGKVDVPIDENWPGNPDDGSETDVLIEKVVVDLHDIGVWPQIWPTLERWTLTNTKDDDGNINGVLVTTEASPEAQIPTDYVTSETGPLTPGDED